MDVEIRLERWRSVENQSMYKVCAVVNGSGEIMEECPSAVVNRYQSLDSLKGFPSFSLFLTLSGLLVYLAGQASLIPLELLNN